MMKIPFGKFTIPLSWAIMLGVGLFIGRSFAPTSIQLSNTKEHIRSNTTSLEVERRSADPSNPRSKSSPRKKSVSRSSDTEEERRTRAMTGLSDVLNIGNRVERTRQMLSFLDQIEDSDMASVISGFQEAGWVDFNRSEYSMLISSWMDRDPFAAISFLDENEADGWTRKIAISAWATENPEAAANAIKGLEDEGKVNDWVVGLIEGMARNDPEGALATLENLPGGDTKWQAIRGVLPEVVLRGAEFAGEWIEQIDEPKLQRDTARRLAHSLAVRDPESASDWISNMSKVATRRDASEVVSEIYAEQNLEAAKAWTESLPQDTLTEAAEGVAKHLARKDPAEAAQWLLKLGDDPDLDGARMRFLREARSSDPVIALENVPTLSRPNDQEKYYRDILKHWQKSDRNAAVEWAVANVESLPEKVFKSVVPKNLRPQ